MAAPIYIIASLWIHAGAESAFEAYEHKAANIMKRYGGLIERTVRPSQQNSSTNQPFEVHVIRFPSDAMFEAYRADPELKELSPERNRVISRTEIVRGKEGSTYGA